MKIMINTKQMKDLDKEDLKLREFKNTWRIITLRSIALLLKNIADKFDEEESEMIIAYGPYTHNGVKYPYLMEIMAQNNNIGSLYIPVLFKYIEEINNIKIINENSDGIKAYEDVEVSNRMYEIQREIMGMMDIFENNGNSRDERENK